MGNESSSAKGGGDGGGGSGDASKAVLTAKAGSTVQQSQAESALTKINKRAKQV